MKMLSSVLKFVATGMALIPTVSISHPCEQGHHGFYTVSTLVSKSVSYTSDSCIAEEPLSLSRASHHYPMLGELEVDYWKGSYSRPAEVKETYRDDLYSCHGGFIGSVRRDLSCEANFRFAVDNPNLGDDVTASYVANAPMTDEEAEAALQKTLKACQDVRP